jgi:hypothetical protein
MYFFNALMVLRVIQLMQTVLLAWFTHRSELYSFAFAFENLQGMLRARAKLWASDGSVYSSALDILEI